MSDIKDHFKMRAERYNAVNTSWMYNTEILNIIKGYVDRVPGDNHRLLEVGAGTGIVSKYLLDNCNKKISVTALDISEDMLGKIDDGRINKVISDVKKMPFDDAEFSIIISRQCLHYVLELESAIREIGRVLSDKGIFVLSQIVPYSEESQEYWKTIIRFRQPLRINYYTTNEWISVLNKNGFVVEDCQMCYHWASLKNWIKKYKICDELLVESYRNLYINATSNFKKQYDIKIYDDDVISKSYWMNLMVYKAK